MGLLFNRNRHRIIGGGGSTLPPYTPVATSFAWQTQPSAVGLYSIGATGNVLAQVLDQHLVPMSPQPSITYTSATPSNISISGNTLTAVANGSSVITASSTGWTNLTGTATASQVLASIIVTGTAPIIGGNSTFTRNGKDALGVNMVSQPIVVWTSSDVSKATINSSTGVATGVASGSVSIVATAGSISGSLPINITAAAPVATTLIWLDSPPSFASIGITANSRAQINDQYGVAMASQAGITYSSNTTSVATINSSGLVTSVSNGSSVLNALYSGVTTIHQTASVSQVLVSIVVLPTTPTVPNGTVQVFTASGRDANAQTMSAGVGTWVSSDPTDFPINSSTGSCTPNVDSGSAVIKFTNTATGIFGTTTITASSGYTLTVIPNPVTGAPADIVQLLVMENGIDVTNDAGTSYSTSNSAIATIDAPTLTGVPSPSSIVQSTGPITFTWPCTNPRSIQTLGGLPAGVTASGPTVVDSTHIAFNLTATGSATVGNANIYLIDTPHGNSNTKVLTVTAPVTFADVAFSFRDNSGSVTVPANCTQVLSLSNDPDPFPTAQASTDVRVTWTLTGFASSDNARTRNTSLGVLAGMVFEDNIGIQATFQVIGLPAGTYSIRLGGGDATSDTSMQYITVKDGATAKLTIAGVSVAIGSSVDAVGSVYTDANWPANNSPLTGVTLSGGNVNVLIGSPSSSTGTTTFSYIRFQQTA